MPVFEWNAPDVLGATKTAVDSGLRASAAVLVESVKNKLGERGAAYATLRKGRAILKQVKRDGFFSLTTKGKNAGKANSAKKRAYIAAREEEDFGKVDDPTKMDHPYPRLRTGNLQRSAGYEKSGELRYSSGYGTEGQAHIYGAVHEFGSLDGNTPARPVWNPSWKGEQAAMLEAFMKQASITFQTGTEAPGQ